MHRYLRAIGFSDMKKEELKKICRQIEEHPTVQKVSRDSEGNEFAELSKEFGKSFGITLRGIYKEDDRFDMEYYYPYFYGTEISSYEVVEVERHAEKESYAGICDEVRIGVTLIFYLQNVADYLAVKKNRGYINLEEGIVLGGLSLEGKVILPINKSERQSKLEKNQMNKRNYLIAAAREGDEEAIESLTLEDIDMYSMLSRRIVHEDVLSIVDSCFMPYGIESDQYSIIGEIMDYCLIKNEVTEEEIYELQILCNGMNLAVCINQKDLLGLPEVGRRFKGTVWMQGSIKW